MEMECCLNVAFKCGGVILPSYIVAWLLDMCFLYYSMLTPIWKILALKLLSCFSFRNFSRDPIFVRFKHFFCLSNNIIGC